LWFICVYLLLDPVITKLPFLNSAWPVTTLLLAYLVIVLKYGKVFMKDRQPFDIKNIIIRYNIFQVIYNFLIFCTTFYILFINGAYNLRCMPTLPVDHPTKTFERAITYIYFVNKIVDLLDTIFFVLRKSYKQITVLHVYHHILMVFVPYWVIRFYGAGGQFATMGLLNSFVHTVMYLYYLISVKYPELKGSLWWKKYITIIQLLQFLTLMLQSVYVLLFQPNCEFPKILQCMIVILAIVFVVMFSNFYIKTYIMHRPQQKQN
ncbi:hypothetical protein KR093_000221, partial [Drosophila rubida]